jgi:hypothetical protein
VIYENLSAMPAVSPVPDFFSTYYQVVSTRLRDIHLVSCATLATLKFKAICLTRVFPICVTHLDATQSCRQICYRAQTISFETNALSQNSP